MNYCKAFIGGNITRDIEPRSTQGGMTIAEFTIAYNVKGKNGEQTPHFFDCKAFDKTAENIAKFFHKGSPIFVECRPQQERWKDKEGKDRNRIVFTVDRFDFCGGKTGEEGNAQPRTQSRTQSYAPQQEQTAGETNEELPF